MHPPTFQEKIMIFHTPGPVRADVMFFWIWILFIVCLVLSCIVIGLYQDKVMGHVSNRELIKEALCFAGVILVIFAGLFWMIII